MNCICYFLLQPSVRYRHLLRRALLSLIGASLIYSLLNWTSNGGRSFEYVSTKWRTTQRVPAETRRSLKENWMDSESNTVLGKDRRSSPAEDGVIRRQQMNIRKELEGQSPHPRLGVESFADLVQGLGGTPVRVLVVTSWRSGSSFFGRLLTTHPATFYDFEPLLSPERNGSLEEKDATIVALLRSLLLCNYTDPGLAAHVRFASKKTLMHGMNRRLWWVNAVDKTLFASPSFMSNFCQLFPYHVMKVVRMPPELAIPLLEDPSLSLKVIFLVRDPRSTMESRYRQAWCITACAKQTTLCRDLVRKYHTAVKLSERFPDRVRVVRFEDLRSDHLKSTGDIFEFLAMNFSAPVKTFLLSNSKSSAKETGLSNVTDFNDGSLQWRTKLSFEQVDQIQKDCRPVFDLYGYSLATAKDNLPTFSSTKNFTFPSLVAT